MCWECLCVISTITLHNNGVVVAKTLYQKNATLSYGQIQKIVARILSGCDVAP
jgi:hypothetical protein